MGVRLMPLVQIHVFKDELDKEQSEKLIVKVTDAITEVTSEKLRDVTWVIIKEIESAHWALVVML